MVWRSLSVDLCCLLLAGCVKSFEQGNKVYPTYGLFNEASSKSDDVCYAVSVGNVLWSLILIESLVFPIYFVGLSIYDPVRLKSGPDDACHY